MFETETSASLGLDQQTLVFAPSTRVRVTQQIPQRTHVYSTVVEGTVLRQERQGSGSWFARNPKNKVWLDRLIVQKADGEISVLNLDEYSHIEALTGTAPASGDSPMVLPSQDPAGAIT